MNRRVKLSNRHLGRVVEVHFADHCEGGRVPMDTVVYGRILEVADGHVVLGGWLPLSDDATDDSRTQWTIVRSTISTVTILSPDCGDA